jgi:hypothetical protein
MIVVGFQECSWKGQQVNCSELFQAVPTDSGMCCAFNMADSLRPSSYSRLLSEMQGGGPRTTAGKAQVGQTRGLGLLLDQQSNRKSFGTVETDSRGLRVFVGGRAEFPLVRERGLTLQPGREHRVELSGVPFTARWWLFRPSHYINLFAARISAACHRTEGNATFRTRAD